MSDREGVLLDDPNLRRPSHDDFLGGAEGAVCTLRSTGPIVLSTSKSFVRLWCSCCPILLAPLIGRSLSIGSEGGEGVSCKGSGDSGRGPDVEETVAALERDPVKLVQR